MVKIVRYTPSYIRPIAATREWTLAVDVLESGENYLVKASVPGIQVEDIEVTFQEDVLTIRAERKADESIKAEEYHLRERAEGVFSRSLRFNSPVQTEAIQAAIQHGVLTLEIPKAEEVRPRKVAVQVR